VGNEVNNNLHIMELQFLLRQILIAHTRETHGYTHMVTAKTTAISNPTQQQKKSLKIPYLANKPCTQQEPIFSDA
jgi:hypothetical protein